MAKIHASAIVEDGAVLGTDVEIGPYAVVSAKVRLDDGVRIGPHVVLLGQTEIGAGTVVHAHAVLGGPAQLRSDPGQEAWLKIAAGNVIREHVTMSSGTAKGRGVTKIGARGYFMSYSHVGHDCDIGEDVTFAAGVPTVWLGLLNHWREHNTNAPSLKRTVIGGSAVPQSMIEAFQDEFGIEVRHAWGMTEMSPLGTVSLLKPGMAKTDKAARSRVQIKQGRPVYGVEMKIVDDQGRKLPHDGKVYGELMVRGPWVTSGYFKLDDSEAHRDDGWFATGDVSTIDPDGYMEITDRSKDVIKSGGEWISSIDLENQAMGHPDVLQAAVIGVAHPKWDERPLLIVVPAPGKQPTLEDLTGYLSGKVAKWWLPDDMVLVDELPLGPTGKILKTKLRKQFGGHKLPTA